MSMQPTTRSSNQPHSGSGGDWRRRLLLFMILPLFDANMYLVVLV